MSYEAALERISACKRAEHTMVDLVQLGLMSLPPEIWQLRNLDELWGSGNQLATLPPEISQLSVLRILDARTNPLDATSQELLQTLRARGMTVRGP